MKRILFPVLFLVFIQLSAQTDSIRINLTSPYQTLRTFKYNLQESHFHPEVAATVFNPEKHSDEEAETLVVELKEVLAGRGVVIDLEEVSKDPDYYDSLRESGRYEPVESFKEFALQKVGENWYISENTADQIVHWHNELYPFGPDILLKLAPRIGQREMFGLYVWQLIGILILLLVGFTLHKILTYLFDRVLFNLAKGVGYSDVAHKVVLPVARPISFVIVASLFMLFVPALQLSVLTNKYLLMALRAVIPLFATMIFYHLVDVLCEYLQRIADRTENTLDDQLVPLVRKALKTFVVIIGLLFILNNLNFDITALIAGLSIGGLAFALAAQDTIKNFFGSLMIFVDKPFQIGDWISSGSEIDGTVEEVGFRSTRLRTFRNSVTSIPNGRLADMTVDNHGLRVYRRFMMKIAVTYDTPPELMEVFVEGLRKIVQKHPQTRKDAFEIYFNEMGDFSLNVLFYIFFQVPTWSEELKARHEVLLEIVKLAHHLGVHFAFPTQTIQMETFPEKKANSPVYSSKQDEIVAKMESYFIQKKSES